MIVARIIGGLGNQLFQYAVARHLSILHNTDLKLDTFAYNEYKIHKYGLSNFLIVENFATKSDIENLFFVKENHFHFDSEFRKIQNNVYLSGYWQSEKYFYDISLIIRQDLALVIPMNEKDNEVAEIIRSTNSVSIHIRRGDYLNGSYNDQVSDCLPISYYNEAVNFISSHVNDCIFFVFSDDINWVKKSLKIQYKIFYIDHNSSETNFQDLRLMSLCKHNIIANSSFSWWGAWLNNNPDKKVISPFIWFNNNARNLNSQDIVPISWIKI